MESHTQRPRLRRWDVRRGICPPTSRGENLRGLPRGLVPGQGFGFGVRGPITARSLDDEREILTVGFVDLPSREKLTEAMARVADQEEVRHDRPDEVIESTALRAIYEQLDEFDFSTDESVAAGR